MHHKYIKPHFIIFNKKDPKAYFYVGGINYIDEYVHIYYDESLNIKAGQMSFSTLSEYETSFVRILKRMFA